MIELLTQLAVIWDCFIALAEARFSRLIFVLFFLLVAMVMINRRLLLEQGKTFVRGFTELSIIRFVLGFE